MSITLYHGDCLEKLKELEDKSIDLVITDPPYGIDYQTFRTKSDKLVNDDNLDWLNEFAEEISRVLKDERHLYCFVDYEMSAYFILAFKKHGFTIRNLLTIPRAVNGIGGGRIFQQQFEFCIYASKGNKKQGRMLNHTKILRNTEKHRKDKRYNGGEWRKRLPDNWHWTVASVHNAKKKFHPTEKNVSCLENMIELSSNEGEVILDPFMGSGSTGLACKNLNRDFIGIEIDKKYFNIAKERLKGQFNNGE